MTPPSNNNKMYTLHDNIKKLTHQHEPIYSRCSLLSTKIQKSASGAQKNQINDDDADNNNSVSVQCLKDSFQLCKLSDNKGLRAE